MKGVSLSIRIAALVMLLLTGCSSRNTRMPSLAYGDPKTERRSYDYHDPLPESMEGPFVERPRDAMRQRAEPRRAIEHYNSISGVEGDTEPSAARYPNVVTP